VPADTRGTVVRVMTMVCPSKKCQQRRRSAFPGSGAGTRLYPRRPLFKAAERPEPCPQGTPKEISKPESHV